MSITNRINHSPRLVGAAVLFVGASMSVLAGPASADSSASTEGQPEKVFVCKYVGTPDVDERLQTGNNPIEVSVNAIPIYNGQPASDLIGQEFADGQGRSIVIAVSDTRGGGQRDEPTIEDCPAPDGPEEPPKSVKVTGTPSLTDPCGPDNEVLSTPPANVIFTPVDNGTFIQVTVSAAAGYVLGQDQTVFNLAVDDAACPTPAIVKTQDQECVGNALVTTFFENGVKVGSQTANGAKECETRDDEVLGEEATDNDTDNNGGDNGTDSNDNNDNNGDAEVLGEQAFSNNSAPTLATQQLPTQVNAGSAGTANEASNGLFGTQSMLGLLMVLLGAAVGRFAWTRRARG